MATDLRVLRIVSYFLRDSESIQREFINSRESSITPVCIRNGSLVDPHGIIASSLLQVLTLTASLSSVSLCAIPSGVPLRLILGLFNFSLAGLTSHSVSETRTENSTRGNSYTLLRYRSSLGDKDIVCDCRIGHSLSPCHGIVIVHSIDPVESSIRLLVPQHVYSFLTSKERANERTTIVRGHLSIPALMIYNSSFPFLPYQTGELAGEGIGPMKARNNVKRKWVGGR